MSRRQSEQHPASRPGQADRAVAVPCIFLVIAPAVATMGPGLHIAIVDDDDLFREALAVNLEDIGFRVDGFRDGPAFLEECASSTFDMALLDWKLAGMSGIELLKAVRDRHNGLPILFLTILSEQIYEEAALAGGAVDFVEKSRSFRIIRHRIDLVLQGAKGHPAAAAPDRAPETLSDGELTLNLRSKRACWRGADANLTLSEFHVLHRLLTAGGEDVSYRQLYDQVHGKNFVAGVGEGGYRSNVRALIKRLRNKLRSIDEEFDMIGNYPGFGYRWGR